MGETGYHKEQKVQSIFTEIASHYDQVNRAISFYQDRRWRRFALNQADLRSGDHLLDVACGTGMMCLAAAELMGQGEIVGVDFCENMLVHARKKVRKTPYGSMIHFQQANALQLPFKENSFSAATMAFGLRNVSDIQRSLAELKRVVQPGGKIVILDLGKPRWPLFREVYFYYLKHLMPKLGQWRSGHDVYRWLPESLCHYPNQQKLCLYLEKAGFVQVKYHELCGGVIAVHVGVVPK